MQKLFVFLLALSLSSRIVATDVVRIVVEKSDGTTQAFLPEQAPEPVVVRTNIGINLAPHRYYSTERPFNDLAKQMSTWQWTPLRGAWASAPPQPLDSTGYPTSIAAGVFGGIVLDMHAGLPLGPYQYSPIDGLTVDGRSDGKFNKTHRVIIRVNSPLASPIRIHEEWDADYGTFYKPFVDRTKQFGTIRFMDWSQTNVDRSISWKDRVSPDWYTQADREVAWEYQFEIAQTCDANAWICIHHQADDVYVRQLAKLAKLIWKSQRRLIVEHSNEVWNGAFPQYAYCLSRSPRSNNPLEYHILRTAEIARIFREEGVEITSVLGAQTVGHATLEYVLSRIGDLPPDIDMIAIAPYFGGAIQNKASIDAILAECDASIDANAQHILAWKRICDRLSVELAAYEAGQHLALHPSEQNNAVYVGNFTAANRSVRMGQLYAKDLEQWDRLTGRSIICLFNSVYQPSRFGSWGLLEHEGQSAGDSPKYQAVLKHIERWSQ